jgi:hypothetical protein
MPSPRRVSVTSLSIFRRSLAQAVFAKMPGTQTKYEKIGSLERRNAECSFRQLKVEWRVDHSKTWAFSNPLECTFVFAECAPDPGLEFAHSFGVLAFFKLQGGCEGSRYRRVVARRNASYTRG